MQQLIICHRLSYAAAYRIRLLIVCGCLSYMTTYCMRLLIVCDCLWYAITYRIRLLIVFGCLSYAATYRMRPYTIRASLASAAFDGSGGTSDNGISFASECAYSRAPGLCAAFRAPCSPIRRGPADPPSSTPTHEHCQLSLIADQGRWSLHFRAKFKCPHRPPS